MEAHPDAAAAIPAPIAAPKLPPAAATPPPIPGPQPLAPPAPPSPPLPPRYALPHLARFAFLVVAALTSASWFVEPFAAAAADLRVPWPTVAATLVCFAAFFCASVLLLLGSFFLPRPPPAAAAATAAQWKGVWAVATAVVVGVAACLVAAGGSAYGYAPARC
ncbi:hypothetical protein BS78_02G196100 [Paspalum vaginatum]|nr:hypothetical protein BS78_02G196100 [Paspalum vaginatum]